MNSFKTIVQRIFNLFGLEVHRYSLSEERLLVEELKARNISHVLDIGANEGQFARRMFAAGYGGEIFSFEPLKEPHRLLSNFASGNDSWIVAPRAAVGSSDSIGEINVSQNSVSSSILAISEHHKQSSPRSSYVGVESIAIITIDNWINKNLINKPFIKIDTQGYEMEVLKGASNTLKNASGIKVEVSIVALYDGQPDYISLINYIRQQGFSLWFIEPGFSDPKSRRLLQFDAIFFRE